MADIGTICTLAGGKELKEIPVIRVGEGGTLTVVAKGKLREEVQGTVKAINVEVSGKGEIAGRGGIWWSSRGGYYGGELVKPSDADFPYAVAYRIRACSGGIFYNKATKQP